jgi:murein DD-endopeptidase MepM/ murein hydrolase activator NlpD
MAEPNRPTPVRRFVAFACAVLAFGLVAGPAAAGPKQRLEAAKARLAQLGEEIKHQQSLLDQISAQAAAIAAKRDLAQQQWELITAQLRQTQAELADARDRYTALQDRLNGRLRQTYMNGPGSSLEFLLGAASFSELSDRMEYIDALAQTDTDLATKVENLRNDLAARARAEARLQKKQTQVLVQLQNDQAAIDAKFQDAQHLLADIQSKKREAARIYGKRQKQYQQYLRSLTGSSVRASGVFRACPVDQPRAVYDGFGAPRYAGGYHPHAGDDILAPTGTPIRAPFDGTAHASYNGLGGNSVYVYGSLGYVYNAHLSRYSSLSNGSVHAGDIIGYVGTTGDAQGGPAHDHFEWHPNVTPDPNSWPKSPYGYSVIDTGYGKPAVNPYPLLEQVC